eukprot:scaffold588_cov389-Prasinococcus_capsulatus_cf.AAC.2
MKQRAVKSAARLCVATYLARATASSGNILAVSGMSMRNGAVHSAMTCLHEPAGAHVRQLYPALRVGGGAPNRARRWRTG